MFSLFLYMLRGDSTKTFSSRFQASLDIHPVAV